MAVVVQKFGGTSLRDESGRQAAIERVRRRLAEGVKVVVVVSAMGREGDPYATDTLLGLVEGGRTVEPDDLDLLLACGEIISAVVFAGLLRKAGVDAVALTGGEAGIITDEHHQDAKILEVDPERLERELQRGRVPVVAGFQGVSHSGQITTLGRGGSDTTAAALGAALGAVEVEIYTDVDGIKTADPRIVPQAATIAHMDYEETFQLAHMGAKVIHPRAVEIARQHQLPLRVLSTFEEGEGTLIAPRRQELDLWQQRSPDRAVVGVTHLTGICQVRLALTGTTPRAVFRAFADKGISVDLINVTETSVSFTIALHHRDTAAEILSELGVDHDIRTGVAKVSVVGSAIHGLPGVMANIAEALAEAEAPILASSDSHLSISCLIPVERSVAAVQALHRKFNLGGNAR
jgi:aspartate kinase